MSQDSTSRSLLGVHQIPNLICVLRVVVTFVALAALAEIHASEGYWSTPCMVVMTVAAFSDRLDGFLAKRYGWSSAFGAILDQTSDKLVSLALFCYVSLLGAFPMWATALIIFRELFVSCLRISANLDQIAIPTSQAGRFKTFAQQVAALLVFTNWAWPTAVVGDQTLSEFVLRVGLLAFWIVMLALRHKSFAAFYRIYTVPRGEGSRSVADMVLVYATILAMALPLPLAGPTVVLVITIGTGWTYFSAYLWARGRQEPRASEGSRNVAVAFAGSAVLSGGLWLALERSPTLVTMWIAIGILSAVWVVLLTITYRTRPTQPDK